MNDLCVMACFNPCLIPCLNTLTTPHRRLNHSQIIHFQHVCEDVPASGVEQVSMNHTNSSNWRFDFNSNRHSLRELNSLSLLLESKLKPPLTTVLLQVFAVFWAACSFQKHILVITANGIEPRLMQEP